MDSDDLAMLLIVIFGLLLGLLGFLFVDNLHSSCSIEAISSMEADIPKISYKITDKDTNIRVLDASKKYKYLVTSPYVKREFRNETSTTYAMVGKVWMPITNNNTITEEDVYIDLIKQ